MSTMKTNQKQSSSLKSPEQSNCCPDLQMKPLQFRSIAPKAPTLGSSSSVVSGQSPNTLPEASTTVNPKSVLVPAQNYAIIQVAGQEGTFSLVALPQTSSQNQSQKNFKLPIPRYQPTTSRRALEKHCNKTRNQAKFAKNSKSASPMMKANSAISCLPESPQLSKPLISSPVSTETLLPEKAVIYPGLKTERAIKRSVDSFTNFSYTNGTSTTMLTAPVSNSSPIKAQTEGTITAGSAITVLSSTVLSKAVQIVPSPPTGKLPILPYAKVKDSLSPSTGISSISPLGKVPLNQTINNLKSSLVINAKTTDEEIRSNQNVNIIQCKKPLGRKRGRKRKTMEDILFYEARKKRSLSFFCRRIPEKPLSSTQPPSSQDKVFDISKKYRSIRPKPVLVIESSVPQLVPLTSLSGSEKQDQERVMNRQMRGKPIGVVQPDSMSIQAPWHQLTAQVENSTKFIFAGSHSLHRCSTCSKCFQFKHHLQSHMNSHSNLRPYNCLVCRKSYAHSGSLSTHMKLHHSEGRPRKSLRCEFCEKAFGYVGVYFSHLREVHRVILTVEPSVSQHEENRRGVEGAFQSEDLASEQPVDPVELQIKCGRCQAITPTFNDMKLHLLFVHGEEVQVRLKDEAVHNGREAENELVKHTAHYWRQLNERRNLVRCGSCNEEFCSFSKLKRHLHSHHPGVVESREEEREVERHGKEDLISTLSTKIVTLQAGSHFNCVLCNEVLNRKQNVLEHWRVWHKCENPAMLWKILDSKAGTILAYRS